MWCGCSVVIVVDGQSELLQQKYEFQNIIGRKRGGSSLTARIQHPGWWRL